MSIERNTSKSRFSNISNFNVFSSRLNKGCGYHLDLLVLAIIVVISSVFGLPWFIANTIPSINHIQSLIRQHLQVRGIVSYLSCEAELGALPCAGA